MNVCVCVCVCVFCCFIFSVPFHILACFSHAGSLPRLEWDFISGFIFKKMYKIGTAHITYCLFIYLFYFYSHLCLFISTDKSATGIFIFFPICYSLMFPVMFYSIYSLKRKKKKKKKKKQSKKQQQQQQQQQINKPTYK